MLYDVIIIGGGPAATAAAVYVARKRLKTVLITASFGGQSVVSDDIQNWIGDPHVSGYDLAKRFETHIRQFSDVVTVVLGPEVVNVTAIRCSDKTRACDFQVTTATKETYEAKAVIVASGARRRKLGVPGEDAFNGKGVSYCSTCDAPLFNGKAVAVIGGGNAGVEAVIDLFSYASKIYLLDHNPALKGDPVVQQEIKKNKNVEIFLNVEPVKISGNQFVTGLTYRDRTSQQEQTLDVSGIFIEAGSVPNSEFVQGLVDLDQWGQIVIDSKHATTSHPGVFAAGDVTDDPYKQNNISAGDGVKAALAAYSYLLQRAKQTPAAG